MHCNSPVLRQGFVIAFLNSHRVGHKDKKRKEAQKKYKNTLKYKPNKAE